VDNGAAALEALRGVKARLLILDVSLPGISGLELHDWLQADEATRGISVVFVTADTEALRQLEERRMPMCWRNRLIWMSCWGWWKQR